ncbi:uncharacterized protein A4U43_C03F9520 [Asparagus officinalis]|uniref:SHSP domain-containing protein n=1 Tax=Asparagus officinalis TaxID=4686 RepID=A0A5P1FBF1_ASPOF|nr:22.3 kDa class VI heat shock protein isoform X3 [Asparagus officinalis]ONK74727.1 uncharacterized protein A4U43_C03F9520 [Asparagus officinalis]
MASSLCHCPAMTPRRVLEVQLDDQNSQKWRVSLTEDAFSTFINHGGDPVKRVFALLSGLRSASKTSVDWVETDVEYVVRAELPVGARKIEIEVCAEKEKVLEISGQWKSRESNVRDWRTGHWWEHGFVRRLELPGDANWRRIEAYIDNEIFLEIKIPKNISGVEPKESECV